jgi:hypothetical protein
MMSRAAGLGAGLRYWRALRPMGRVLAAAALGTTCSLSSALATPFVPPEYLVIATGEGSTGNEFASFHMSNVEIGADQEIVSNSSVGVPSQRVGSYNGSLDLTGTFVPTNGANASKGGNRWNDVDPDHPGDTVGIPDTLPGARPIFEGIDFSGNVALTGSLAKFESSNSDVNADVGIQCNRTPSACFPNPSSPNSFFQDMATEQDLNALNGVSQFDPSSLITQLEQMRDIIVGLPSDATWTSGFSNINIKDSGAPLVTDLDAIDAAGTLDGFAVIDLDLNGNKFELNNTDWILQSSLDTLVIFRMADGTYFDFANSSILLGDGLGNTDIIDELGAIFFQDAFRGTNELFNLNNVILGGVLLADLTDFNPNPDVLLYDGALSQFNPYIGDRTAINLQNAQGCAQFISHEVIMSDNRWTRCSMSDRDEGPPTEVPEPASVLILIVGLLGLSLMRRQRAA